VSIVQMRAVCRTRMNGVRCGGYRREGLYGGRWGCLMTSFGLALQGEGPWRARACGPVLGDAHLLGNGMASL
jgi:hypothetical protein